MRSVVRVHLSPLISLKIIEYGGLAQLGERLPCKQEVTSSNLVFSTLVYSVVALLLHYFCVFDKFIYVLYNTLNRKVGR